MTLSRTGTLKRTPLKRGESKLRRTANLKATKWGTRPKAKAKGWRADFLTPHEKAAKLTPYEKALHAFVRRLPCVVCHRAPTSRRPNEVSHCALSADEKGTGMKVPHGQVASKCRKCHSEWEERRGFCAGWTRDQRFESAAEMVRLTIYATIPEDREHAETLERWGLGRVVEHGDGSGIWHWEPGSST